MQDNAVVQRKAATLRSLIASAKNAKKGFTETFEEIERYDALKEIGDDDQEMYQRFDIDLALGAKVYKTQQYKREVGPRIYNNNPTFNLSTRGVDPIKSTRSKMMEEYLNYIPNENRLYENMVSCIDDGLGAGRGVCWFGLSKEKDAIATAMWDSVKNLYIDGDPEKISDIRWIARERKKPRWELVKLYPDKRATIEMQTGKNASSDNHGTRDSTDIITYYEMYMKVGLHNFMGDTLAYGSVSTEDKPVKFVFMDETNDLLFEGDWEIPFHLDGEWPCSFLDFYQGKKTWPISPLKSGLGWQRAINWVATMMVAKYSWSHKTVVALLKANGVELSPEDQDKIASAETTPVEIISLALSSVDGDNDIRKYMQQIEFSSNSGEALQILAELERRFEQETGLHEFLMSGTGQSQDRSAAATRARQENTKSRIVHMQQVVQKFITEVGRKLAMTARYLLSPEDVKYIFPNNYQEWGLLFSQEQLTPEYWMNRIRNEDPYMDVQLLIERSQDIASRGVSLEEWVYETDYQIESGSTLKSTPEREADAFQEAYNTVFPALMQAGRLESASMLLIQHAKHMGLPDEAIQVIRDDFAKAQQEQEMAQQLQEQQMQADMLGGQDAAIPMPNMPQAIP